jgi:hypothetical protein
MAHEEVNKEVTPESRSRRSGSGGLGGVEHPLRRSVDIHWIILEEQVSVQSLIRSISSTSTPVPRMCWQNCRELPE